MGTLRPSLRDVIADLKQHAGNLRSFRLNTPNGAEGEERARLDARGAFGPGDESEHVSPFEVE